MNRKVSISFSVSLDSSDPREKKIAEILIDGLPCDEEGLLVLNRKALVFYALEYLHKRKQKVTKISAPIQEQFKSEEKEKEKTDKPIESKKWDGLDGEIDFNIDAFCK